MPLLMPCFFHIFPNTLVRGWDERLRVEGGRRKEAVEAMEAATLLPPRVPWKVPSSCVNDKISYFFEMIISAFRVKSRDGKHQRFQNGH